MPCPCKSVSADGPLNPPVGHLAEDRGGGEHRQHREERRRNPRGRGGQELRDDQEHRPVPQVDPVGPFADPNQRANLQKPGERGGAPEQGDDHQNAAHRRQRDPAVIGE